jgi:hypothetical protein
VSEDGQLIIVFDGSYFNIKAIEYKNDSGIIYRPSFETVATIAMP